MQNKPINNCQVINHGIMLPDYFQGCGVYCTKFTDVATGIGDTEKEAFDDACESLSQNGWDTSTLVFKRGKGRPLTVSGYLRSKGIKQDESQDSSYWHISIRVN